MSATWNRCRQRARGALALPLALLLLPLAAATAGAADTTVILVRHAEKELTGGDVPLRLPEGVERAQDLVEAVREAGVSVAISSTWRRTRETVAPAVEELGIAPERVLRISEAEKVAEEILSNHRGRTVLVAGHSDTVPEIVERLGAPSLCPPFEVHPEHGCLIPDAEYDHLFVVIVPEEGPARLVRTLYGAPFIPRRP